MQYDGDYAQGKGFTVVELTIVIAIISILAVVALPKLFSTSVLQNRVQSDDILNSIRYAQSYAIRTGCHVSVNIDFVNNILTLQRMFNAVGPSCVTGAFTLNVPDPVVYESATAATYTRTLTNGVVFSSGTQSDWPIYFDSLGRAYRSAGTRGTYTLSLGGRTINIIGDTGFIAYTVVQN